MHSTRLAAGKGIAVFRAPAVATLLLSSSLLAWGAPGDVRELTLKGPNGPVVRKVREPGSPQPVDGICGVPLYYQGIEKSGMRKLECNGEGVYQNGSDTGKFTWYYGLDPKDPAKLFTQTFEEWGMGPSPSKVPAVLVYMKFTKGNLAGETYGAVIGVVDGQVQLSPHWASER